LTESGYNHYSCFVVKTGIMLIGMAGVGKSTVGRALAAALGFEFIDLDDYLSRKEGKTIQQIIDGQGEQKLLDLEHQSMRELNLARKVVSPGGSIVYDTEIMDYLKRSSHLVYLDDTFENIKSRLGNAPTRGIVGLKTKSLRQIYDERRPLYSRYADITVEVGGKSKNAVVAEILKLMPEGGLSGG
jgi:shikimate kinase